MALTAHLILQTHHELQCLKQTAEPTSTSALYSLRVWAGDTVYPMTVSTHAPPPMHPWLAWGASGQLGIDGDRYIGFHCITGPGPVSEILLLATFCSWSLARLLMFQVISTALQVMSEEYSGGLFDAPILPHSHLHVKPLSCSLSCNQIPAAYPVD